MFSLKLYTRDKKLRSDLKELDLEEFKATYEKPEVKIGRLMYIKVNE